MPLENEIERIPESSAVMIPPYINIDPILWFHMVESTFQLAIPKPITESRTMYNYVVAHLPPETATTVRDIITMPDKTDPYLELKNTIIDRCGETKTQEIRRLLSGESLGDRKPSELLRIMKRRAESHNVDDTLLFELFNQAMPIPVQTILASISPITSAKAAEVADRILDITPNNVNAVSFHTSSLSPSSVSANQQTSNEILMEEVQRLRKEISALRRSRSTSRNRNSNDGKRSKSREKQMCWYHIRFQSKARKCLPPCKFTENDNREA